MTALRFWNPLAGSESYQNASRDRSCSHHRPCAGVAALPWMLALVAAGATFLHGCRARPGIEPPEADAAPLTDSDPPDSSVPACQVSFAACRLSAGPVLVGEEIQDPSLAWTGGELLLVYADIWRTDNWSVTLKGYSFGAEELFRMPVGKWQSPNLAWHPQMGRGLVATDLGLRWLDGTGQPSGNFQEGGRHSGSSLLATVAPVPGGFLVVASIWGEISRAGPLEHAWVGTTSQSFSWTRLESRGLFSPPAIHRSPQDGLARWVATTSSESGKTLLYRVGDGILHKEAELFETLPRGLFGSVEAITEQDDHLILLYITGESSWGPWSAWLVRLTLGALDQPSTTEQYRIDQNSSGSNGEFLVLGGQTLLASSLIHEGYRLTLAPLCLDAPEGPLCEPRLEITPEFSHSPTLARTPRGFAIAWFEYIVEQDDSSKVYIRLAVYDCCVE